MSTDTKPEATPLSAATRSLSDADATEYRGVTVLMADLVASTDRMEELGAEDYADLLRRFHTICTDAVRAHGGMVAQYQGDGIICYFGFPRAGEDDAARAVAAALDIVDALRRTGAEDGLDTRIGLSSGTVMLRSDGDKFGASAVGTCINRAARLEALAERNSILVCASTRQLIGQLFQIRDLGEQTLKGFRKPQHVFEVRRARSGVATRFEALRGHRMADLVGRTEERARLRALYTEARDSGAGRAAVISGEAGLGKSRLVSAFQADPVLENAPCFLLQCSPEHVDTPLYPIARYLEWVAGTGAHEDDAARHAKLKRLISSVWGATAAETDVLLDLLSPLGAENAIDMSESVPLRRQKALRLLTDKIFGSVAGRGAFVVVFEDVHWIDPTSAAMLEILIDRIRDHAALLLMTTRPEQPFGDGIEGAALIRLSRLDTSDAAALARQTLGDRSVDDAQIDRVVEKSEGVPLFVQEYADMLAASANGALPDADVPLTLTGLVQSKLDRLDTPARLFAQAGAALGRDFDPELVAQVLGQPRTEVPALSNALADLRLAESLSDAGAPVLSFSHALIRDAIYAALPGDRRRKLHDAIVGAYLSLGDRIPVGDHVLADHLARAGRLTEAVERYLAAGMAAAGQGAAAEALAHLEAGLTCVASLPEGETRDLLELRLCAVRGPTLMVTRGPGNPDFGETQARAMSLLDRLDLHATMVPVIYNTALHAWATADLDRALTIADAIAMIDANDPSDAANMAANTMRGLISWHKGRNEAAIAALTKTVARHDPDLHRDLYAVFLKEFGIFSLFYLGLTNTVMGRFDEGRDFAEQAVDLSDRMGFPHERGFGLLARFNTAMLRGDVETACEASRDALDYSTRQGFPEFMAMAGFVQGWCATQRGDLDGGVQQMTDGLAFWTATGFTCWQALFAAILAPLLVRLDRIDEAEALVDRYTALIDRTGENQTRAPLLLARALCQRARGHSDAEDTARTAMEHATEQGAGLWQDWIRAEFAI